MANTNHSANEAKLSDTARIDRRNTILAQIEAALLSDKLELAESQSRDDGNPYNSGKFKVTDTGVWKGRPR